MTDATRQKLNTLRQDIANLREVAKQDAFYRSSVTRAIAMMQAEVDRIEKRAGII